MKILFVITLSNKGFEEPRGILYLPHSSATSMKLRPADDTVAIKIASFNPGLLSYSTLTPNFQEIFDVRRQISNLHPGILTIMGGQHPTFFPKPVKRKRF